jgi:hypothetical protein
MVTRRTIQACGTFDDADNLVLEKVPAQPSGGGSGGGHRPPIFVGDLFIRNPQPTKAIMMTSTWDPPEGGFDDCRETHARIYNRNMARMSQSMIDIFSSGIAKPVSFAETKTFKALFLSAAQRAPLDIDDLRKHGYINDKELELLRKQRVHALSDLYSSKAEAVGGVDLSKLRSRILKAASARTA